DARSHSAKLDRRLGEIGRDSADGHSDNEHKTGERTERASANARPARPGMEQSERPGPHDRSGTVGPRLAHEIRSGVKTFTIVGQAHRTFRLERISGHVREGVSALCRGHAPFSLNRAELSQSCEFRAIPHNRDRLWK